MDALIAYIDNGVTAALKAEAEKSSQGSFDKDEVETISEHICCTVISGTQPSLSFAFVGSPRSVSTSAGRK